MKNLILFCVMLFAGNCAFAQFDNRVSQHDFVALSVGAGVPFMNNDKFDQWMQRNYGRHYDNLVDGYGALTLVFNRFDAGLQVGLSSKDFAAGDIYFGTRITPYRSPITSFLNLGLGFNNFDDDTFAPLNYTLTSDQVSQKMYMRYTSYYLSLSSINYINPLSFNLDKKGNLAFRTGFFVDFAFASFGKKWQYGYKQDTDETGTDSDGNAYSYTGTKFIGTRITSVPTLGSQFLNLGITVSLTVK